MIVQQMPGSASIDNLEVSIAADEYLVAVEEFDELWSAGKSLQNQLRMDELLSIMLGYEQQCLGRN